MKVSDEKTIQHLDTDELIFHLITIKNIKIMPNSG